MKKTAKLCVFICAVLLLAGMLLAACTVQDTSDAGNVNNGQILDTPDNSASYCGTWESLMYEKRVITIYDNLIYLYSEEDGEGATSGPFEYTVSKDADYTYLELINPFDDRSFDLVLVWLSKDTMALCERFENGAVKTPSGTEYSPACVLMARQGTCVNTRPAGTNLALLEDLCRFNGVFVEKVRYMYSPDCSVLSMTDGNRRVAVYVGAEGEIYIEDAAIMPSGYENIWENEDVIITDHHFVITDYT